MRARCITGVLLADDLAMVRGRGGDHLQWPERTLAGQCPGGLRGRPVSDVLAGRRDNNRYVEDLRRDGRDRDVLSRPADQDDALLVHTDRAHGVQARGALAALSL